jgi:ribonuclease HI
VGLGALIRDHNGDVQVSRSTTKRGCFEPTVAEALSLLHGLLLCVEHEYQNVVVQGDAQVVIMELDRSSVWAYCG